MGGGTGNGNKYVVVFPRANYPTEIVREYIERDPYLGHLISDCICEVNGKRINPNKVASMSFREKKHLGR